MRWSGITWIERLVGALFRFMRRCASNGGKAHFHRALSGYSIMTWVLLRFHSRLLASIPRSTAEVCARDHVKFDDQANANASYPHCDSEQRKASHSNSHSDHPYPDQVVTNLISNQLSSRHAYCFSTSLFHLFTQRFG